MNYSSLENYSALSLSDYFLQSSTDMYKTIGFLSILAILASCNAVTSPTTGQTTTEGAMTATVNGSSWSTAGVGNLIQSATATRDASGKLTIVGSNSNLSSITLYLLSPAVGSITLGTTGNEGAFAYGTVAKDIYASATGSVTITKFDTVNRQISGSFTFTGYQIADTTLKSVSVTNGSFLDIGWSK
jgi:hypothetical protein